MSSSAVTSEAILFFDHRGISKSMLYSDFEAILDGMVGVPEFADKEVRGAYCVVNGQLKVRGLVLFTIDFDEDGMADTTWNVPLRHLVEHADPHARVASLAQQVVPVERLGEGARRLGGGARGRQRPQF